MCCEKMLFEKNKNKILRVLQCASKSEYYNKIFIANGVDVEKIDSYEDFTKIPILDKSVYNKNKLSMLSDREIYRKICESVYDSLSLEEKRKILEENGFYLKITSGSTGIPLEIVKGINDIKRDYLGLNLMRKRIIGELPRGKYVWIWPANQRIRKYFYAKSDMNVYQDNEYGYKYMIPEYSDETFENLYNFIVVNNIAWITAPPSMLYMFAKYVLTKRLSVYFNYIETHSEKLYSWQAELIGQVFGTEPVNVYSSNEIQFMGITCRCGNMHIISQNVFLELLPSKNGTREVVATSLTALESPIIRYKLGDLAEWDEKGCDCDLKNPCISVKGYRSNDYLITNEGKKFEPFLVTDVIVLLNNKFNMKIEEYVVQQTQYDRLVFYFHKHIVEQINNNSEIVSFISDYFFDVTQIRFFVQFDDISVMNKRMGVSKYKYFIGMKMCT